MRTTQPDATGGTIFRDSRVDDHQEIWPDGAPKLPKATPEQDTIPVPDGYPSDTWADDDRETGWLFAVHPALRQAYTSIPVDDSRLDRTMIDNPQPFPVGDRVKGRVLKLSVVQAWPHVFTPVRNHSGMGPGHMFQADYRYGLHLERKKLAWTIADEEEKRRAERDAVRLECDVCGSLYLWNSSQNQGMCGRCHFIRSRYLQEYGEDSLDVLEDGRTRYQAVLDRLAAEQGAR